MKTSILKYMSDSIYYNVKLAKLTPNALKTAKKCEFVKFKPEIILINNTIEIPLPTPFSVIRSPIHISTAEPAVSAATTTMIHVT